MKFCRALLFLAVTPLAYAQPLPSTPYSFTTVAGAAVIGSNDGPAGVARFNFPRGIAADPAGNLYVADTENNTIRKISPAGVVSTLAGKAGYSIDPNQGDGQGNGTGSAARFTAPAGVVVDGAGNVFVVGGDNAVRKITPGGAVTTVAGGGPASSFNGPQAITLDAAGNLYVADSQNFAIKKITPAGVVTTLAGGSSGSSDGHGSAAQFDLPGGIAVDSAGTVYVADTFGHTIRKISPTGDVTTFAGTARTRGCADGAGTAALFNYPGGLTIDLAGNLYVADSANCIIRKITPTGLVSTMAGASLASGHADGMGTARFFEPAAVALDPAGNLLVADHLDQTIRRITPSGVVSTIAGLSPFQFVGSNDGAGTDARFNQPLAVTAGPMGDLYVADAQNHTIRKIAPNGFVVTFAGLAGESGHVDGKGAAARFNNPNALAADAAGNIYVADNGNGFVRKITPDGTVTTVAGRAGFRDTLDGPPGTAALGDMVGIAVRPNGNLVVSEQQAVREITPDGAIRSLSVVPVELEPRFGGIAVDSADNVYVLDRESGQIIRIAPAGSVTRIDPHFARFASVWGIALDHAGNIFVTGNNCVWKVSIDGVTSILGGLLDAPGSADGVGEEARFDYPTGVAVDAAGNVYVTCSTFNSNTLRKGQAASAPVITSQPQSLTVARGANAQFSVTASGFPAPTYQWYFDGAPFNGATTSMFSLANVQSTDAGDYTVVVTNSVGTVTSNKATLTVSSGPVTPPTNPSSGGGGGGGAVSLWFYLALLVLATVRTLIKCVQPA
jgi:sugar lactone lactonase YvrE